MAVNNDMRDDNLERDPKLAQMLAAASSEAPPAALDAAILAAARRAVDARPRLAGGGSGSESSPPPARAKRHWYVPVSIAAVMVLSVSLVTLIHEEKGDELAQPPVSAPAPAASAVKAPPAAESEKRDTMLRDAAPAKPAPTEKPRGEADNNSIAQPKGESKVAAAPETYAELAKKQRSEKMATPTDGAAASGAARKEQAAIAAAREQTAASDAAASPPVPARRADQDDARLRTPAAVGRDPEVGGGLTAERQRNTMGPRGFDSGTGGTSGALGGATGAVPGGALPPASSSVPPAPRVPRTVGPAPEPFPAQAPARDALETRPRGEADRATTRGAIQEAPAVAASPAAPAPQAKGAAPPRVLLWRGLEGQPPEKWLERMAEFKRDNRQADADALLAEFRRRFPDHPASGR